MSDSEHLKPLLIGMAQSDGGRGRPLLPSSDGGSGAADRLMRIANMDRDEYLASFRRCNLLPNGHWSGPRARLRGAKLMHELRGRVIVLGRQTWHALWLPRVEFFGWVETGEARFILLPHPSGRNLLYNDRRNIEAARRILRGD